MDNLVDLGVGAAVALLILERVFGFLKTQRRNGNGDKAGEKPVAEWEQRIERVVERVVENKLMPSLSHIIGQINDIKQSIMTLIRWKGSGD